MRVSKQFFDVDKGVTPLLSDEDMFVPEMSLPIEQIMAQFSFVDNMRLSQYARQGFENATTDDDDFNTVDIDQMDLAEREEVLDDANKLVKAYQDQMKRQKQEPENTQDSLGVDESVLP